MYRYITDLPLLKVFFIINCKNIRSSCFSLTREFYLAMNIVDFAKQYLAMSSVISVRSVVRSCWNEMLI